MTGRNMNVYFQEETYSKIKNLVSKREVSRFINEAVEEKLQKKQQQQREELRQKLIAGYKSNARNERLKKELRGLEEASLEDVFTKLDKAEKGKVVPTSLPKKNDIGNTSIPRKGEIWLANNPERIKELGKDYRPVLIISNDEQNEYDDKLVVVPLTADDVDKVKLVEVFIKNTPETGLDYPSKILLNYPFTLDKDLRLEKKLGIASKEIMEKVEKAWKIAFI
ncbi:10485_t:CDS:2 [Gigaspora margarita]|uniref:10485_t:CDS:1 n=1 Tax=Gigaspora margarita TaxID=4874 RepID=A0ABM8VWN9_GIGMA|nr:10485_t:CDS:2 [Gigaspora margarita]